MPPDHREFRRRLEAELSQVSEMLAQAALSAGTVTLDQASVGRVSRIDAIQQQAMAIESRERLAVRVRRIEATLNRINAGTFGSCCSCGAGVEPERLQLDATTVFCADCQREREAPRSTDE
jgi:DnaK suppressor protein